MLSASTLREILRRAGLDAPVRYEEVTGSTNQVALDLAEAGAPEWTLVAAGHQTAGRGRLGRGWVSDPGRSLLVSLVLRPPLEPERAGLLTLLAGASLAETAREVAGVEAACKWPNDLLVGEGKAGGILAEAKVQGDAVGHVVLGIGVNLSDPPPGVEGAAGLGGADAEALLSAFLRLFRNRYRPDDPGFARTVLSAYRPLCATLGRRVRAVTVDGRTVEGDAVDVDEAGNLLVDSDRGREVVGFGEVQHLER